jgi:hypothetical protein
VFVEAWQRMDVGHDLFVGCIEVTDKRIAKASEVAEFEFQPSSEPDSAPRVHDFPIFLEMTVYENGGARKKHSISIPTKFINHVS